MTPKWKRAGTDGEIEIKFPTGRRFKIEKQYDENIRHKGEWKVMEWDARSKDWEWGETYSPKAYAKQKAMEAGQYDTRGKKVADYSKTFQFESVNEEAPATSIGNASVSLPPDAMFKPRVVIDKRRRKDKIPRLLKRFRKHLEDN
jgi:hypothetical protein